MIDGSADCSVTGDEGKYNLAVSNLDGQALGKKGLETRKRLLVAAKDLLQTTPLRDIRVADISRGAGISAATFYLYFENVEAAVLALSEDLIFAAQDLLEIANRPWPMNNHDNVTHFVRSYFDFWDIHRNVLRVRNLAAEEGNYRFNAARLKISEPLHRVLGEKILMGQQSGEISNDLHDLTLAATILASMERNAAGYRFFPAQFGVSRERLIAANIFQIRSILFGHAHG